MSFEEYENNQNGALSQINVAPLVDVALVLLVIFMVAAPILQQGVELDLPEETLSPLEGEGEQVVVSIDKNENVYIGAGNKIKVDEVGLKLKNILETKKDKRVFIKADKSVKYGAVMAVMGSIRRAQIFKVGLITEPS